MDALLLIKAALLGVVEGLTEFLPISSTGHLILAGSLLGFTDETTGGRASVFEIAIQTGAIFAVIGYYRARIGQTLSGLFQQHGDAQRNARRFTLNIAIAFAPAVVLGLLFGKVIKAHLFHPLPVAIAFIVGALVILWVERLQRRGGFAPRVQTIDQLTPLDALKVGFLQCAALIPGTSRSGATIIGGMWCGLSRQVATEFSFFLAMPTLIGAGVYSLWKARGLLSMADWPLFLVGFVFAFLSAMACVHWLLRYIARHDFTIFAWYRIVFGIVVLLTFKMGWLVWQA